MRPINIVLRVNREALREWHGDLAQRLAARAGTTVGFQLVEGAGVPMATQALFQIETLLFRLGRRGGAQRMTSAAAAALPTPPSGAPDLTIDLGDAPAAGRNWRVECDGAGLEAGLLAAALAGRTPLVRVVGPDGVIAAARPGSERGDLARTSLEDMLARVTTLIVAALDGAAATPPPRLPGKAAPAPAPTWRAAAKRAAYAAGARAARGAYAALCNGPHWRVGWRRGGGGLAAALGGGWTDLPDDGARFYADPFAVVWRGRTYLFVEDFAHALARGVISAVEVGADGPMGAPSPVLDLPYHLSYPNVFERDGEMWMIPESSAAGTVDLYRATHFPGGWKHERTLVRGVVASDATLVERDGRWWMFATVRDGGGAFSDALHLWSAADFRGPWTPHPKNPVMIDIASARPAGAMFLRDGALYRPVQDGRAGYGAALGLARVERLDEGGFSQTVEAILRPGKGWAGRRLHTYNTAGGFEFIDGSAFAPRWSALRRPRIWSRGRDVRLKPVAA